MRAVLVFKLPQEDGEFRCAVSGSLWEAVAWEMDQYLRGKLKYGHTYDSVDDALEDVREHLRQTMDDHSLVFDL